MEPQHTYNYWVKRLYKTKPFEPRKIRDMMVHRAEMDGPITFTLAYRWDSGKNEKAPFMTLTPDNMFTLSIPDIRNGTQTLYNRIREVSGLHMGSISGNRKEKRRVYLKDHNGEIVRVAEQAQPGTRAWYWSPPVHIPYEDGMVVHEGYLQYPARYKDYKVALNREKALPLRRSLDTLARLLKVAARMEVLDNDRAMHYGSKRFDDVNIAEPTAEDAQIIYAAGWTWWRHYYGTREGKSQAAVNVERAKLGLEKFRKWLYDKNGCYDYEEVSI